jgi:hypothetical protein
MGPPEERGGGKSRSPLKTWELALDSTIQDQPLFKFSFLPPTCCMFKSRPEKKEVNRESYRSPEIQNGYPNILLPKGLFQT